VGGRGRLWGDSEERKWSGKMGELGGIIKGEKGIVVKEGLGSGLTLGTAGARTKKEWENKDCGGISL